METTEEEDNHIPKFDSLERFSKCHNTGTGAEAMYMTPDEIQSLYKDIIERVNQKPYNPSQLEKDLLNGVIYPNPMYNEDNTDATFGLDRIDDKLLNFEETLPTGNASLKSSGSTRRKSINGSPDRV